MSRFYEMQVGIELPCKDRELAEKIFAACRQEWPFTDFELCAPILSSTSRMDMTAQSYLCGGETEDKFVDRLSRAIWTAAGQSLEIEIHAMYLEDLPYELHTRGEDDYAMWLEEQGVCP